ncbi:MAG: hypothetical protein QXP66_00880 [Candidatus Aenigmatarchaeota archaeon]
MTIYDLLKSAISRELLMRAIYKRLTSAGVPEELLAKELKEIFTGRMRMPGVLTEAEKRLYRRKIRPALIGAIDVAGMGYPAYIKKLRSGQL